MSLTSFLKTNADVRERFRQEFDKPTFAVSRQLLAPPLSARYSLVGTAFDYLLRFFIQHLNPHTIDRGHWVAESALELLADDEELRELGEEIVAKAKTRLARFLKKGTITNDLIESAISLATLDPIFRAGVGHEQIGISHKDDIKDLKNLIGAVDRKAFCSKKLCMVNPTFGDASVLVGGADADLVIDQKIIDVKTTKKLALDRSAFDQILGYYILHHIAGVGELQPKPKITKLAIYFSRYGYFHEMNVSDLISAKTFPKFVRWFKQRAAKEFPEAQLVLRARRAF